jgi:hypothetical protein
MNVLSKSLVNRHTFWHKVSTQLQHRFRHKVPAQILVHIATHIPVHIPNLNLLNISSYKQDFNWPKWIILWKLDTGSMTWLRNIIRPKRIILNWKTWHINSMNLELINTYNESTSQYIRFLITSFKVKAENV